MKVILESLLLDESLDVPEVRGYVMRYPLDSCKGIQGSAKRRWGQMPQSSDRRVEAAITVAVGPTDNAEELSEHLLLLRHELLQLDGVDVVQGITNDAPSGAKAGLPLSPGELFLTLAGAGGVLTSLIGLLRAWLTRDERRRVTIEVGGDRLEISGLGFAEQRRLIDSWLSRHTGGEQIE